MFKLNPRSWFRRASVGTSDTREAGAWTELSAEEVSAALDRGMGSILETAGFEHVAPRKWVRGARAPIREIVDYQAYKGATYQPEWGVSLDFVPTPVGRRLKWKRTSKAALLDLRLNRIGTVPTDEFFASRIVRRPRREALALFEQGAARASKLALTQLESIMSLEEVVRRFEQWASMMPCGLGAENFVQTDLAWGLSQLACGKRESGERLLDIACKKLELEATDRVLLLAKAAALELSV